MKKSILKMLLVVLVVGFTLGNLFRSRPEEPVYVEPSPEPVQIDRLAYWKENPEEAPFEDIQNAHSVALVASAVSDSIQVMYGVEPSINCQISIMQCVLNRVGAVGFPETIIDVCEQPNQWQGLTADTQVHTNLQGLALDLIKLQETSEQTCIPKDCVYFCLVPTGVEYRAEWESSPQDIHFVPYS